MALTCQLARVTYLALYEELASDGSFRAVVEKRLEDLGPTSLDDLVSAYRLDWRAATEASSAVCDAVRALEPLDAQHGALASWLIAPLRSSGDSTEIGNRARTRALSLVDVAGLSPEDLAGFGIAVVGWTVGQVWGTVDRSMPVIPATPFDDEDLRIAYEGLLQHSRVLTESSWSEMAGSAVFWRVGGVTEALRPQPLPNLANSLGEVMRDCKDNLPASVGRLLTGTARDEFISSRNAFTHVKRKGSGRSDRGFADVHEAATDDPLVKGLLRAASCFVCGDMSYRALNDDNLNYWTATLDRILDELRMFADYVDV